MALLDILTYPDPFLAEPAKPLDRVDASARKLIDRMAETMFAAPGVGLAANQVGQDKQIIVYTRPDEEGNISQSFEALVNPVIVSRSGSLTSKKEGCLSVPGFKCDVSRSGQVTVDGLDRRGRPVRIKADGMLAVILQHETDHLSGLLFIDRISALKRSFYKKRLKKKARARA
ncbi:peptide deformylase [Candidatus Desulfarcum epimagneticum]|uniref:Peptide deformylase n=1 Tax=uncultured Desulfobacteraceae bacterium TaxID=218296 RepID=A0A484HDK8_9BACT|nr:peptide deformylase [uncultured Desulfobacteraceae bacterium]